MSVQFVDDQYSVQEDRGPVRVELELNRPAGIPVTAVVMTVDGSATSECQSQM